MDAYRTCKKCNKSKSIEEFVCNKLCKGGYEHQCVVCRIEQVRKHYNSIEGRAKKMFRDAKARAKKANVSFDITLDWILVKLERGVCEETGIILDLNTFGTRRHTYNAPSLDRVIPELGYTKENTKMTCFMYNCAKNEFTKGELFEVCSAFVNNFEIKQ